MSMAEKLWYFLRKSDLLPQSSRDTNKVLRLGQTSLPCFEYTLQDLHDKATHLVAEDPEAVPEELLDKKIVSVKWIEACLARHEQLPVTDYAIDINKGRSRFLAIESAPPQSLQKDSKR